MLKVGIFIIMTQVRLNNIYIAAHRIGARQRHPLPIARIFDQGKGCDEVKSSITALSENPLLHAKAASNIESDALNVKRFNYRKSQLTQEQSSEKEAKHQKTSSLRSYYWLYLFAGCLVCTVTVYKYRLQLYRPFNHSFEYLRHFDRHKLLPLTCVDSNKELLDEGIVLSEVVVVNQSYPETKVQTVVLSKDLNLTVADRVRLLQYAIDCENASKANNLEM